jgi:hypothetical protein
MKKCKGHGRAINYGCGLEKDIFKYGLCKPCYAYWLYHTPSGLKFLNQTQENAKKKVLNERNDNLSKLYSKPRKKYTKVEDMSFPDLKVATQRVCNDYIRLRDEINFGMCISSETKINDAGHFFSIGENAGLRFSPQNIHGQSRHDNYFLSANKIEYEKGLRLRHGNAYMDELYRLNTETMRTKQLTRDYVLKINKLYKRLAKKGIWIFTHEEFEDYLNII